MRRLARKQIDSRPLDGALRYRIRFAWLPVETTSAAGPSVEWRSETIWLENVMEVQEYRRGRGFPAARQTGAWAHNRWYPVNDFTTALWEHNNQ
jgi:hypothetical protein